MTVASAVSRKTYAMDGTTTSFATSPMVFFDTSDLLVYVTTEADGSAELLVENTDYTVSGGAGSTGTVDTSAGSSPYGAGSSAYTLVIVRSLPLTQEVDLENNDGSDAEVQEDAFDRLTMIAQQLEQRLDFCFHLADSDVTGFTTELIPEDGTLLGWGETGLVNYALDDTGLTPTSNLLRLNVEDQGPVTGGVSYTEKDLGTVSSGTTTLDYSDRAHQKYTNGGAHTLAPDTAIGSALIAITNNASAGAITTSGWTKVVGAFTTTNAHKFLCHASTTAVGSLLTIQAMQ